MFGQTEETLASVNSTRSSLPTLPTIHKSQGSRYLDERQVRRAEPPLRQDLDELADSS
jgi:hypothetical protein